MNDTIKAPPVPDELWMLWVIDSSKYLVSIDEARGGTTYLIAFSKTEAEEAARHQFEQYFVESIPVRVK